MCTKRTKPKTYWRTRPCEDWLGDQEDTVDTREEQGKDVEPGIGSWEGRRKEGGNGEMTGPEQSRKAPQRRGPQL